MITQDFLFRKCRRGMCRVANWIVNMLFLYQAVHAKWFTLKNAIVRDTTVFVKEVRQVGCNI